MAHTHFYHQREGVPADTVMDCPRCGNRLIADQIIAMDTLTPPQIVQAHARFAGSPAPGGDKSPDYICNGCFSMLFGEGDIITKADWLRQVGASQSAIDRAAADPYWPGT